MQTSLTEHSLISVIIPAFNAQDYITKALDSTLIQSYQHIEVLVINDGSTDNTKTIVESYQDPRVKLISQSNGGLSNARNTGIKNAQGHYLAFLDADDYWMPEKLEKQIEVLEQHTEISFCSTQTRVETPGGDFINTWFCPEINDTILRTIFSQNAAIAGSGSSVMLTAELQKQAGVFDESLHSLEDIDMWMRYAAIAKYCCIPETLSVIIKRTDSMSRNLETMRNSAIRVLTKNKSLLNTTSQKTFWHSCYANMLYDYAKWEARSGFKIIAIRHTLLALIYAPKRKGRLCLGLLFAIVFNRPLS